MESDDVLDLPVSINSCVETHNNVLESVQNSPPEAENLIGNEENMSRDLVLENGLDLLEENLRAVDTLEEQVSHVVDDGVVKTHKNGLESVQKSSPEAKNLIPKSGVKRPRTMSEEEQPTVHVAYKNLTRASKQKLESLLQQWSEWEAECASLAQDQEQTLESGEMTYFPALRVGLKKTSSVSFWMDNQTGSKLLDESVRVESSSTPLYDRTFSIGLNLADGSNNLEGGLEIIDDPPRCFNCGGYSHSLKDCPKPFDRSAVNSARKHHKSKRNQSTSGPRLPSRYHSKPQSGKYDGLKPGTLDTETRQLLNLGELDPPPWLNRMREIGYPPGYLAPEDDLSGITIFGEELDPLEGIESEDGEILEKANPPEPQMKMTVEFPGFNAPLPENADEWLWEAAPSHRNSSSSGSRRWEQRISRGQDHHRSAQPRDYRDDDDRLGAESSSYPPRYGSRYDYGYGLKDYRSRSRSPGIDRSLSERSKRDYSSYDTDRDRDRDRNRDRDRERERDDRDWSYRLSSRR
ncbi:unnamed protein product [Cochlearia groenlandica]